MFVALAAGCSICPMSRRSKLKKLNCLADTQLVGYRVSDVLFHTSPREVIVIQLLSPEIVCKVEELQSV